MADIVDKATRSRMMSTIKAKNTKPEIQVRRYLHAKGVRYRLHDARLPGQPDIVLPRFQTAIFVHGCFWHRHQGCSFAYDPKSRRRFWGRKFTENVERDRHNKQILKRMGWRTLTIWECDLRSPHASKSLERLYKKLTLHK